MQTLLSKAIVSQINSATKQYVTEGVEPHLAVVLIGEDIQSLRYVELKTQRAKELGILLSIYHLAVSTPYSEIEQSLRFLADDPEVHGIILQLPLPATISVEQTEQLFSLIPLGKDVDGLRGEWTPLHNSPRTITELLDYQGTPLPPMVCGVLSLLDAYSISMIDQQIVIIGAGRLVGQPLERYFKHLGLQVTLVTEETDHILDITRKADILITGTGQPNLVTYQWVKEGVVVINCSGDIHEDSVSQVALAMAPSIGSIGPLTVAWLLHNVARRAQ